MIKVGDKIPSAALRQVTEGGVQEVNTEEFFKGKRVALFAVPGAFTSVCSAKHLPSFANNADAVTMLSDGNGDFARALGVEADMTKNGMGRRSRRYSMLVENGVVKQLNLEEPGAFGVSSGDHLLTQI